MQNKAHTCFCGQTHSWVCPFHRRSRSCTQPLSRNLPCRSQGSWYLSCRRQV